MNKSLLPVSALSAPWAIESKGGSLVRSAIEQAEPEECSDGGAERDYLADYEPVRVAPNAVAVYISGVFVKGIGPRYLRWGYYDTDILGDICDELAADPTVRTVYLRFDTPGGSVLGAWEVAMKIRALDEKKTCISYTEDVCCSLGMFFASQCSTQVATHSAMVGSIGTIWAWLDWSDAMKQAGVSLVLFKAGKYKAIGRDGYELTDDDRALMQGKVEALNAEFIEMIRYHRPNVPDDAMQGQTLSSSEALEAGMIDEIVDGFDELVAETV